MKIVDLNMRLYDNDGKVGYIFRSFIDGDRDLDSCTTKVTDGNFIETIVKFIERQIKDFNFHMYVQINCYWLEGYGESEIDQI